MLIRRLQEHFPARLPEWFNAFTLFAWGAYVLIHPGIFTDHMFTGLVSMGGGDAPLAERTWGLLTVTVGMLRVGALFVNGAYSRTPAIRLAMSAISAFVWSQVLAGLLLLPIPTTGVVMYSAAVVLDIVSAYRAACDAVIAETSRRSERGQKKRGKPDRYNVPGSA